MKRKKFLFILFLLAVNLCKAQETVVLDTSMFDKIYQAFDLGLLEGWIFHEGNNLKWAAKDIDTTGWKKFSPYALSVKNADKNGRVEGWFRLRFKLDSNFSSMPFALQLDKWVAKDVYIDGAYITSDGNTGINGKPYKEGKFKLPVTVSVVKQGNVYTIAVHVVDYVSPLNPWALKGGYGVGVAGPDSLYRFLLKAKEMAVYFISYAVVCAVLCLLFFFLYFQNRSEKVLLLIALGMTLLFLQMIFVYVWATSYEISFLTNSLTYTGAAILGQLCFLFNVVILARIFRRKIQTIFLPFILLLAIVPITGIYITLPSYTDTLLAAFQLLFYGYLAISSWRNLKGAQWAVVGGILSSYIFGILFGYTTLKYQYWPFPYCYLLLGGMVLSLPVSLMVYVAMRFKEILKDVQTNAKQVVQLSEEKKEQALNQQKILEEEVARQTIELRTSLENLKSTQAQLIQAEKMASLGELTAGIAHEIQNPLNFVNNFSEVNKELAEELKTELLADNKEEAISIAYIILDNEEKINHHGKRADAIVKGMLQHSRTSSGQKELTDINALCDEYLRLAYHGLRAKDKNFNAEIKTDFDESIGNINVVPQDIGRVLLNLYHNAFYAVNEKTKLRATGCEPRVVVETKKINGKIEITVSDNGNGIPHNIVDKIFQPFFTTKPTGLGTGLGLSLCYDIIKAHGGEIKVESKEGEGTTFAIQLPKHSS